MTTTTPYGPRLRHGAYVNGKEAPEHYIWRSMIQRCKKPKKGKKDYYKGIKVCERWKDYKNFIYDMGERPSPEHSIERMDTWGDYEPFNCKWATKSEQQQNKTNTKFYEQNGEIGTLIYWSIKLGISKELAHYRWKTWGTFKKGQSWQLRQKAK